MPASAQRAAVDNGDPQPDSRGQDSGGGRAQGTRKKRTLRPGDTVTVRFDRMGPDGEALAALDGGVLAVPYAAPGEEASVRITEARGRTLRGRLVALRSVASRITPPPCPHFGVCGGCQWQHLDYPAQLEQKTWLVREALARAGLSDLPVDPAIGWEPPWEFRTQLEAAVSMRQGRPVLGFFAWGGDRVVGVGQCPVQHPRNVTALRAVRAALESSAPAFAGRAPGSMILRAVWIRVGAATGEVMVGLGVSEPLSVKGREMAARMLLDRIPGLVSIMEFRVLRRGHVPRDSRAVLLWGRAYLREEVEGVRYQVPLLSEFPFNARVLPGLIEIILTQLDAGSSDAVVELDAGIGAYTLHLALNASRAIGFTTQEHLDTAWRNARFNQITNVTFTALNPLPALTDALLGESATRAFLHPPGSGLAPNVPDVLRRAGAGRVVYLGRSLSALGRDVMAIQRAGFRIIRVQPIDVSPQTSRVNALLTCVAD